MERRQGRIGRAAHLGSDTTGAVAVLLALMIALLVGFVGLTVDLGQLFTANSEHQSHADAAAIVGASQLDGELSAIDRAEAAIENDLIRNRQTANGGVDVEIVSIRFLSSLPDDDKQIKESDFTENPTVARCVQVTTRQEDIGTAFVPTVGGPKTAAVDATAIACSSEAICDIPPMMMCNPTELDPTKVCSKDIDLSPGQQVRAKKQGSESQWTPGGFGFIDPPSGSQSAPEVAMNLGRANPSIGCISSFIDIRPGQVASAMSGMNVRMDIYNNPFAQNLDNDWDFRPAKNVTKGFTQTGPTVCDTEIDPEETPVSMGMPRDSNIAADADARFGNSNWDRDAYWIMNHAGVTMPAELTNASRYEFYKYENYHNIIPDNYDPLDPPAGENGNASCHSDANLVDDNPDRRMMIMAVVNCVCHTIQGNESDVPVVGFIKTFMSEPVSDPGDGMEYIFEYVDKIKPGNDDGLLHTIVQLYK